MPEGETSATVRGDWMAFKRRPTHNMADFTGTIHKSDLSGGFWELRADTGKSYQLRGENEDLRQEGMRVVISGAVDKAAFGIGMTGPILDVRTWKPG